MEILILLFAIVQATPEEAGLLPDWSFPYGSIDTGEIAFLDTTPTTLEKAKGFKGIWTSAPLSGAKDQSTIYYKIIEKGSGYYVYGWHSRTDVYYSLGPRKKFKEWGFARSYAEDYHVRELESRNTDHPLYKNRKRAYP